MFAGVEPRCYFLSVACRRRNNAKKTEGHVDISHANSGQGLQLTDCVIL
jgi:hypothetical protein